MHEKNIHFSIPVDHVSDTAWLVAAFRAEESRRQDAHFQDRFAEVLIGEKGKKLLSTVPHLQFGQFMLVVRTCVIDQIMLRLIDKGCKTIINLACGLDTRPYRLTLPSSVKWIEVDFPGVIEYKASALAKEAPRCHLERLAVDLRDREARQRLLTTLCQSSEETLILTEGLLYYLSAENVATLAQDLFAQSNIQWWLMDLFDPALFYFFRNQDAAFSAREGQTHFLFAPPEREAFFTPYGWRLSEFRSFAEEGQRLNRLPPPELSANDRETSALQKSGVILLESLI